MEIFRTDGGGRTENPIRLIATIAEVEKSIPQTDFIWSKILAINDHKGILKIVIYPGILNLEIETELKYFFGKAWKNQNEDFNKVIINDADSINFIPLDEIKNISKSKLNNDF